ncbi:MAG: AlpA family phage regulatory protein, partial [Rubrivivax sp.]|nr:AlpA family phage regulatory protein [Rubrivivax sp.]
MEDSAIGHAAQLRRALPLKREAEQERLLRISEVEHLCGLKKSSLYAAMAAREFPASVALSGKAV